MACKLIKENGNNLYLEKELLSPYTHILQVTGKRLRVKIARAFNHWLRLPEEKLIDIVNNVNMLHVSSLLVDDIQDNTRVRRGMPAAHRVFGLPLTINTSFHGLTLVLAKIVKFGHAATQIFSEDFLEVVRGQGVEIYWRDNFVCPTEEQYKKMIQQKTGRMFAMSVRICQLISDYEIDLTYLALHLGLYFQIRDDYCNLKQQEALEEWPGAQDALARKDTNYCEDLTEGKFSLPIIHAMSTPQSGQILSILRQRTEDVDLKRYCVKLLEQSGSLQYTYDILLDLEKTARAEVARLGGNPEMEAVLDEMQSWKCE